MYLAKKATTNKLSPSASTTIREYLMPENSVSGAVAEIRGKYPEIGFAVNQICKELVYIISGAGKLVTKKKTVVFSRGDSLFIAKGEAFYWEGNFTMYMVTVPKFDPKQHIVL
ncbi:MAG: hypothetical protein UV61_C0006G0103 [Candidatus Gottesmanbacteria bacterium GW2011_GWB1_43_11]|uniref:(S)-ureidoglycine aminohydrolase cupin domain-containing protein n=1 Tax=Candidatus Gottesmanbacteria bacterium GW2011_GWB1_43_11 TaxID=1618446 RepID=A0A0G1CN35_9BACT|nr:MAG: hypothetical protein UV04_C0005G0102 [Candidatus Gottesmanbacteria bacterium GW2011_GWA2_42_16]KKS55712.1 MAG: hypothetical protein UV17_C0008G0063 [Candidatus Gottesmanbacteria bacterium GW2011_GWA1_42_26]KKS81168.1 MAG: hypothetical protein UV55_C0019G0024 [Candidatus Gottesmanbacteria bacterium GW2011_GWC1_43_10]KKS86902.1 MAG: hypothetical protein UV61_C0006G0103 [Candidatus Gottesmanbacteria bacterium GW2011_GWB1_43_11]OGG08249.1 MAG: hypothetical protein A2699_06640 [Candidatus Go